MMRVHPLELKFGTALLIFHDIEQMKSFLVCYCYRDRQGRIWLHHGCVYHEFTELCSEYYANIPEDVRWRNSTRTHFMIGKLNNLDTSYETGEH